MSKAKRLLGAIDRLLEATRRDLREARLRPIERRLERSMARVFRAEGRAFLRGFAHLADRLPGALDDSDWGRYLDAAQLETREAIQRALEAAMQVALSAGILHAAEALPAGATPVTEAGPLETAIAMLFGIKFDLRNPRAVAYLQARGAALVTRIGETTRDYIRTVITEGASKGSSYDQMARTITARYKEFAVGRPQKHIASRAHLIAVTEVGEAYSHGNYVVAEGLRDAGLQMEKQWDTMGDERVSDGCRANEAAGWIPLDQSFPSGHMRPLRFPGCRCDLLIQRVGAGE